MPQQSPSYPHISLEKALERALKIFNEDRTNIIDRETAAKHVGYSSVSGASEKMLATITQYGLLETSGKGQVKLTSLALDIFAPENDIAKKHALYLAGTFPSLFSQIDESFETVPSQGKLENWMIRRKFVDSAIKPASKSYFRTKEYLERQDAVKSDSSLSNGPSLDRSGENNIVYGSANVGDLVQWELDGTLQLPNPARVRSISEDSEWVFVENSETGIPMSQVIIESKGVSETPQIAPPILPLVSSSNNTLPEGSVILSSGKVKDVSFEVRVTGDINQRVIDRIIAYLNLAKSDYEE